MDINTLKQLVNNKIQTLENQKNRMFENGDIDGVTILEGEILKTKATLEKLETL